MPQREPLPPDPLAAELDGFIRDHRLAERGRELDRDPQFPRPEFRALGEAGWLGLASPTIYGGRGLPLPRAGALLHRLAYRAGTVFAKLALQPEFSSVLAEHGSPALREGWVLPLAAGLRLVGNQITEPGAGSDVQSLGLEARREGDAVPLGRNEIGGRVRRRRRRSDRLRPGGRGGGGGDHRLPRAPGPSGGRARPNRDRPRGALAAPGHGHLPRGERTGRPPVRGGGARVRVRPP